MSQSERASSLSLEMVTDSFLVNASETFDVCLHRAIEEKRVWETTSNI